MTDLPSSTVLHSFARPGPTFRETNDEYFARIDREAQAAQDRVKKGTQLLLTSSKACNEPKMNG